MLNLTDRFYSWKFGAVLGDLVSKEQLQEQVINGQIKDVETEQDSNAIKEQLESLYTQKMSLIEKIIDQRFSMLPLENIFLPVAGRISTIQGQRPHLENVQKFRFSAHGSVDKQIYQVMSELIKGTLIDYSVLRSEALVENTIRDIKKLVEQNLCKGPLDAVIEVELYASCIVLDRVRVYENLSVRKSGLDSYLLKNAGDLYVISEALLGGLFFGTRTAIRAHDGTRDTSLSTMSISQKGTVSQIVFGDLDATYENWKRDLLENRETGYPFAYKVKNLKSLLT